MYPYCKELSKKKQKKQFFLHAQCNSATPIKELPCLVADDFLNKWSEFWVIILLRPESLPFYNIT